MSEVSNEQILQAIFELSDEVAEIKADVKENSKKIDKLDSKVTVLSEGLLDTQAEVRILKKSR